METRNILDHLDKFIALSAVAQKGSIRAAAQYLKISQPSLSIKIKNLENALDLTLLKRSREGIALTPDGLKALHFSNDIIGKAEELKIDFERSDDLTGHVRIGVYDSIARYFWPSFYKHFSKKFPAIVITLSTGRSKNIEELVVQNNLDMGIVVEAHKQAETQNLPLYSDLMACYCTRSFFKKYYSRDIIGRSALYKVSDASVSLILFSRAILRNDQTLEKKLGVIMDGLNVHRVENFEIARAFCLDNIGMAILPNRVVQEDYKKNRLIKVKLGASFDLNFGKHAIELAVNRKSAKTPLVDLVTNEIREFILHRHS